MADFRGYLLKAVDGPVFPHQFINYESWDSTPKQREEIKAYRDENSRDLTRITAAGRKSVFQFNTRPKLHLANIEEILHWFYDCEVDHDQRKMHLEYWNEEDITYKTGYFYRPDTKFPIKQILPNDIIYRETTINFVEY